jgi:hypothetical protein
LQPIENKAANLQEECRGKWQRAAPQNTPSHHHMQTSAETIDCKGITIGPLRTKG